MSMPAKDKLVLGLDIGGSTTKAAALEAGELLTPCRVVASDPVSSAYGALGRFLDLNKLKVDDIDRLVLTGVGSAKIEHPLLGIPTYSCDEFQAVARGGLYLSGKDRAVVVSMGTGTSLVLGEQDSYTHIIGSGIGGGTLLGLSSSMLNIRDYQNLAELAAAGDLDKIDLSIGDLVGDLPGLPADTTAANFGKVNDHAEREDLAAGLFNLVFQPLGTIAVLAARLADCDHIVFVGSLAKSDAGQEALQKFSVLYQKEIMVPDNPEFATAIGAALSTENLVQR